MNGINTLAYFTGPLFTSYIGLTELVSHILSGALFTFQLMGSFVAYGLIDRLGRRKLMLISSAGMGTFMLGFCISISQTPAKSAAIAASVFVFLFTFSFPVGFLGPPFLYATEIAPLAYRVHINAVSTATTWAFNFLIAEVTPTAVNNIHWRYYLIFAIINLCIIVPVIYFFFPETAARPLEEIDEIFMNSKNMFEVVPIARRLQTREVSEGTNVLGKDEVEYIEHSA
ncbi:glucose-inactivated glycerol proton symporter STL1 [Sugiyamaella lignohabitans]|uniref:Glucose-inactivated glycerol proton symporter STL1 n=1 Tax=Sugiyamaella lignohabitans TaxID=796027 RepID=A0A167FZJ2_9ASCO|nr:glucose-inactivated glycerol proton symporter STL1 [Sugiyamaella lignohabitans]ANB15906.1 glucose-inactivated glycerol proton symporter STL1 [Sugiyamaella lignohabitans]